MGNTPEKPADNPSSRYYFDVVPIEEAVAIVRKISRETGTETISIDEGDGRTLSGGISARSDIPGFDRSWRDGYAVLSAETSTATAAEPVYLTCTGTVRMGTEPSGTVGTGTCMYVPTGGQIPTGADAVVMVEYTGTTGDIVQITRPVSTGENIIRKDEDFLKGDEIFPAGWIIRPQDIGVLASIGRTWIPVRKKPVIGIISTGLELIPADAHPRPGEVREVNSYLISVFCRRQGAVPVRYGIIRDDEEELVRTLRQACTECDAVMVSGGSSKDQNDITSRAIEQIGEVFVHGISIAPGKPTIIGKVEEIPVIGLPGHPTSTFMVLTLVGIHLIQALKGSPCQRTLRKMARMAEAVPSERGREQYMRVRLQNDLATPVLGKSGLMNTLTWSDGIIRIPVGCDGYDKGDEVEVMIW